MPFLMDAGDFARRAHVAIERGVSYRVIPWQMGVVARLMHLLPNAVYDRLARNAPRNAQGGLIPSARGVSAPRRCAFRRSRG